jgi:hypothetical protein
VQTQSVMGQRLLFQQRTSELKQLVDIRKASSPLSSSIQRGDFSQLELEQYNKLNTATHRLIMKKPMITMWIALSLIALAALV